MSDDVWSAEDTSPDAIDAALRQLLRKRHAANESLAPARVLNLVVIADRDWKGEVANRLERVGRYHASRTLLCTVEEGRTTLDATAVMSYQEPQQGRLGVIREQVEIDMGPRHLGRIDTIIDPVLVSELPTMLWSPHGYQDAVDRLRGMIDVMLLDSDDLDPPAGLARAAEARDFAYVVDLAWLRTTPWRERLAASFDPPQRLPMLSALAGVQVRHQRSSGSSALLLAGWLSSRLQWKPEALEQRDRDLVCGTVRKGEEPLELEFEAADQDVPGLVGVTVSCDSGFSLSLDRAKGGLCAREHSPTGGERVWQVLGASRGEGGILGEGVRQALLRDSTYGPALAAAREMWPR